MQCPFCERDHIMSVDDLPSRPSSLFSPCPECVIVTRPKDKPVEPPPPIPPGRCRCGRRFIDDVMADTWLHLKDRGFIDASDPLSAVGTPMISPGIFLLRPPVLPSRSLLLISDRIPPETASFLYRKVPELLGIICHRGPVAGAGDQTAVSSLDGYEDILLCGCDIREDIFHTSKGPVAIAKLQHALHIEFPKGIDPKIQAVESQVRRVHPDVFIDACAGPGTLGLVAALLGVKDVVLCDVWYASVWSIIESIELNKRKIGISDIAVFRDLADLPRVYAGDPELVCEASGPGVKITVFQGSYESLASHIPVGNRLTAFDPFDKAEFAKRDQFLTFWQKTVGGEVFIP